MTDKDFDRLLKDALSSDEVPLNLNESLFIKAERERTKKAKILSFTKACSSLAAVFVCAIAVLSYFNSDLFSQNNALPSEETNIITKKNESEDVSSEDSLEKTQQIEPKEKKIVSAPIVSADTALEKSDALIADETKSFDAVYDAQSAQTMPEEESVAENSVFAMRRAVIPENLEMLFNDGYDYKNVISEKIIQLVKEYDFAQEINFSQINGDEKFSLNEENMLTIEFAAGTIAPLEHGDLFFTVGTVQNGVLVE